MTASVVGQIRDRLVQAHAATTPPRDLVEHLTNTRALGQAAQLGEQVLLQPLPATLSTPNQRGVNVDRKIRPMRYAILDHRRLADCSSTPANRSAAARASAYLLRSRAPRRGVARR